jgi:hypothetical protein
VVYATDPGSAPDAEFVAGRLELLVPGNRGRLLDARRTPITVTAVDPSIGGFEVEIRAFEDAGARWELPLEDVARFQFERTAAAVGGADLALLRRALARFDRPLTVGGETDAAARTEEAIARERRAARTWIAARGGPPPLMLGQWVGARAADSEVFALLEAFLDERGLAELDARFAERFVSNPASGELVKGHAIVLAELGLCRYRGKALRDPRTLQPPLTRDRRAAHIVARLAFLRELWSAWECDEVTLYRGLAVDGPLPDHEPSSFPSATFSAEVADAHFEGGPTTRTAALIRQQVPVDRLFMTFLETPAMNRRFLEAEAVLIGDPENRAF